MLDNQKFNMLYAVIRLRSAIGARRDIKDTLMLLNLRYIHSCVLLPKTPSIEGMLRKIKDYITYGEIDKETLTLLLQKRLKMIGNKRVDENELKEITGFDSFEKFAEALLSGKVLLKDFEKLKRVFRLNSPRGGLKSKKKHYPDGDLGYRGKDINNLLKKMI